MTRYIIHVHNTATAQNQNFAGEERDYYYGKGSNTVATNDGTIIKWLVEEYGYKTKASAMKGYKAHKELEDWQAEKGFWTGTVELEEVTF